MTDYFPEGQSPRELGYSMPAEWSLQESVLLSWPLNKRTWPGCFPETEQAYADFAAAITHHELLRVICPCKENQRIAELLVSRGAVPEQVEFLDIKTNDAWCRDHGPVFVRNASGERAVVDFLYNAWGGKFPPWNLDNAVPEKVARAFDLKRFPVPFVCEGGALETNGRGDLLTTRSVILNPNRNKGITEKTAEKVLCDALGMNRILWLDSGLPGDDTDGHIDTLARFFREDAVLAILGKKSHPGYETMKHNFRTLEKMRTSGGEPLQVLPLPVPEPIRPDGWREEILPATYANYLLVNGAVLVPSYRQDKSDREAQKVIADAFPGREIIPIDCFNIILEGGALHCLSQQQPL